MRREYPATSAAKIAASFRSTLCSFGGCTGPPIPLGNRAPGAVKVQAALLPGRRRAAMAPPGRESSLLTHHRRSSAPSPTTAHRDLPCVTPTGKGPSLAPVADEVIE